MTQQRGVNFGGLQALVVGDLHNLQDRLFGALQDRMARIFSTVRNSNGAAAANGQSGVLAGLLCSLSGHNITVGDGQALIYDSAATGEDSAYRVITVDSSLPLPASSVVALPAAHATLDRIDAVTVSYATGALPGDTAQIVQQVAGAVQATSFQTRTRPSATINVVQGTPAAGGSATPPAIPAGQILLAYCYTQNAGAGGAVIAILDSRAMLSDLPGIHGVLYGCALGWVDSTHLSVGGGVVALNGELYSLSAYTTGLGGLPLTSSAALDQGGSTATGFKYLYVFRKNRDVSGGSGGSYQNGAAALDHIFSSIAPNSDGRPSLALHHSGNYLLQQGLSAGGILNEAVCLGSFYWDSTNGIIQFVRVGNMVLWPQNATQVSPPALVAGDTVAGAANNSYSLGGATVTTARAPTTAKAAILELSAVVQAAPTFAADNQVNWQYQVFDANNEITPLNPPTSWIGGLSGAALQRVNSAGGTLTVGPGVGVQVIVPLNASQQFYRDLLVTTGNGAWTIKGTITQLGYIEEPRGLLA